ncbi:MAG: PilT/PilU family type 4a pilus ATPase [Myxococcales bacterium]|jgi:twitching motility protein PilT
MPRIDAYLQHLRSHNGSDLHLIAGIEPRMRSRGLLEVIGGTPPLEDAGLRAMLREITTEAQWQSFERKLELDFAYSLAGVGRFRANYFVQENGVGGIFRLIPEDLMTLADLNMPPAVTQLSHLRSGLVLVTGPTGSGKSTTLAAMIDEINQNQAKHILTIEDPVEFVHKDKASMITQREVGTHTESFASGLRAAIRQNADVVLVGEMRGAEAELAIVAAEMGALVFGTLHTNSAIKTIDRLIDMFPTEKQDQIRVGLAEALAGVVSQLLIPTADGRGRVAAVEILMRTTGLPNIIREGNTVQLLNVMQGGKQQGMQTMDDSLERLMKAGMIRPKDAYQRASDKQHFENMLDVPVESL